MSKQSPLHRAMQGFTLIEVIVVIVILSILATIVIPRVMNRPEQAREVKAKQDIRNLGSALNLYRLDNYQYPTTDQGLQALVTKPTSPPEPPNWNEDGYLSRLPQDPWGNQYQYLSPGQHGKYDLYSLGADDQIGGKGKNADIDNWKLK